jgi:hypothetical protein
MNIDEKFIKEHCKKLNWSCTIKSNCDACKIDFLRQSYFDLEDKLSLAKYKIQELESEIIILSGEKK